MRTLRKVGARAGRRRHCQAGFGGREGPQARAEGAADTAGGQGHRPGAPKGATCLLPDFSRDSPPPEEWNYLCLTHHVCYSGGKKDLIYILSVIQLFVTV